MEDPHALHKGNLDHSSHLRGGLRRCGFLRDREHPQAGFRKTPFFGRNQPERDL